MTVHMTGGRKTTQKMHTTKAARHYAKSMCASPSVQRITLAGPDIACELYAA